MDKKVKALRAKKLEEYKIEKLAELADGLGRIKEEYERSLEYNNESVSCIKSLRILPIKEEDPYTTLGDLTISE